MARNSVGFNSDHSHTGKKRSRRSWLLGVFVAVALVLAWLPTGSLVPGVSGAVAHADDSTPLLTLGGVTGSFYADDSGSSAFSAGSADTPLFTQSFPLINFNPDAVSNGASPPSSINCSNAGALGVNQDTRPFTDVLPNSDGSCTAIQAQGNGYQAGGLPGSSPCGGTNCFQASFATQLYVSAPGSIALQVNSDDGWFLGMGPNAKDGQSPSYVSGDQYDLPTSMPFHSSYAVLGGYNAGESPTGRPLTIHFPSAGVYPLELDYTEVLGGQLQLILSYNGQPIRSNDTWVHALPLDQMPAGYEVNQTITQTSFGTGQEAWYRFPVTPGSSIHIQYSGDPGTVLSLHSDLQAEYNAITNAQNTAVSSAQGASSGFLPQQFLPQQFLPQQFLPQQFLPQQFLPQQFLPQQFLPQQFLPQQFLPQQFLPQQFLPQQFLPGPYSGAVYASLLAVSAVPSSSVQTIDHNTWNAFGYMYVRVVSPPDQANPFTLTVTETGGVCSGITPSSYTPSLSGISGGASTLILWDSSHIAGTPSDITALTSDLNTFAARTDVNGAVVDLKNQTGIQADQAQADSHYACPTAKNIVAGDIKSLIQAYRGQNPGLSDIVLVGDDHSIPYFRYPDESGLGTENLYYPPVADNTSSNASLRNNYVLGQDSYGSSVDLPVGDLALPVPGLPVGRLVRTASEVDHTLSLYTSNSILNPTSSLVTGYDFVADAATKAAADLTAGTGNPADSLISPEGQTTGNWTATDLRQKLLLGNRHDIVFMAGHFSAGAVEAADYSTSLSAADVASSSANLSNSLVLALGCHGGYTIPGGEGVSGLSPSPDWTEAMALKGATLLASTGYAYGDTVLTEYGEHLYDNFVHQLRYGSGPVDVGNAEVAAKQEYLATHTNLTGVDEKTLLETTLYGLPMFAVNLPQGRLPAPDDGSVVPGAPTVTGQGAAFGLASYDYEFNPTLTSHTTQLDSANGPITATYLTGPDGGEVARPGEPIFPSESHNVSIDSEILRGVGFRGGSYNDTSGITPLTSATGTETSVGHPAFYTNVFYPTQLATPNFAGAIGGGTETLDTTAAQYMSDGPASTTGILRKYTHLHFRLFYLPQNWNADSTISQAAEAAPSQIASVSASTDGTNDTFNVHVLSDPTAGTQGVWITYTDPQNPGTWTSLDLTRDPSDPTLWTATTQLPSDILFMVQAVNGAGLVTLSTNSGAYYSVGAPQTTSVPTTLVLQSPPTTGIYQSSSQFHVLLTSSGSPLSGQAVTLQVGSQEGLGVTDGNGLATISVPLNQIPGKYTAFATFGGQTVSGTRYLPSSSGSSAFTITPAPTTLTLTPAIATSPFSVIATLKDNSGNPLVQHTVLFTVTGGGHKYQRAFITDGQGQAHLGFIPLAPGLYSVLAAFGGANDPQTLVVNGQSVVESDPQYLTSTATGIIRSPSIVALDGAASAALATSGNGCLSASGQIYVNSSSPTAISAGHACGTSAPIVSSTGIGVVGGSSSSCCSPAVSHLSGPVADPFTGLVLPTYANGSWYLPDNTVVPAGKYDAAKHMYSPGYYPGGIALSNGAATLAPGVYILDGGGLTLSGGAALNGTAGVFIYNTAHLGTCGAISVSGSAKLTFTAPTTGALAGLTVAQDPQCNSKMIVSGTAATVSSTGSMYLPAAPVEVSGSGRLNGTQMDLVVDTFLTSGNAKLS